MEKSKKTILKSSARALGQLKIELLTETAVSKRKFEDIAGEGLKVPVDTELDAVYVHAIC